VIEALLGHGSEFNRTPKYRVEAATDDWKQKRYRGTMSFVPFIELVLGIYFSVMAAYAFVNQIYGTLPFILIFQCGFLYTAALSLFENMGRLAIVREQEA
jgi:galactitol-specific phosphotransferase system IIC component